MRQTDTAYLAGLVDGEGYVGIKKAKAYKCHGRLNPGYHPRIQIRMVDEGAIRFMAELLGGWYYQEKAHCNNGRPLYCFQASDASALKILGTLRPFLQVKRAQADLVLRLGEVRRKKRRVSVPTKLICRWGTVIVSRRSRTHPDTIGEMESLWMQCRLLNGLARI